MKMKVFKRGFCVLILTVLTALTAGCAGRQAFHAGEDLAQRGQYDQAVSKFFQAVQADPGNAEYRINLANARQKAAWSHLKKGQADLENQKLQTAASEFEAAAALNPDLESARQKLQQVGQRLEVRKLLSEAGGFYRERKFTQAREDLNRILDLIPGDTEALELLQKIKREQRSVIDGHQLDVSSEKPITLKFKDTDIHDVFNILSRLSGIDFIFDEDVPPRKVTVFLENATFAQALELLLKMNNLDKKILNSKTVLLYPNTPQKKKQYQDQVIQTFYLSYIDAKKAVNLLRTMLQLRKIYVHEALNALVIRDTPDVIRLAQKILEAADRPDSEVVFDLELVEVEHSDTLDVGPRLSSYSVSGGWVQPGGTSGTSGTSASLTSTVPTEGLPNFLYTLPTANFNFQKQLSGTEILANPKIRVKNRDKAKVIIGSREPVVTTTTSTTGELTSSNVQYIDVGVKLNIQPTIELDNSVVAKLDLEVSNVTKQIQITGGGTAFEISTTNAQTTLTLKDGQTTIIGGLFRHDSTNTKDTFPFLGRLPLIGDLISGHSNTKTKREILLSITPHIVRNLEMPRPNVSTIWSGGENDLKPGPALGAFAAPLTPSVEEFPPAAAPGVQPPPPLPPPAQPSGEKAPPPAAPKAAPAKTPAQGAPPPPSAAGRVPPSQAAPKAQAPIGQGRVTLSGPSRVKPGETVTYEVAVRHVEHLFSAPLFLIFNPKVFEFVNAEEGGFLQQGGQRTVFATSPDQAQGRVLVGSRQTAGGAGATGSGTLYRVTFKVKPQSSGSTILGIDRVNLQDPAGNRLKVSVKTVTPVEVQ